MNKEVMMIRDLKKALENVERIEVLIKEVFYKNKNKGRSKAA